MIGIGTDFANLSGERSYSLSYYTKGALLYSPDGSMCALRGRQPGRLNVWAVLRRVAPYKGLHPLRCHSSYPSTLCSGNSLLAQTIPTAKPENPYRYQDRLPKT